MSSCFATAGKSLPPTSPRCVAWIARIACSPSSSLSPMRSCTAFDDATAEWDIDMPLIAEWLSGFEFELSAPDAAATTARARTTSSTSEVFRFFIEPPNRLTTLIRTAADYGSVVTDIPTREDVLRARATIGDRVHRTP